MTEGDRRQLDIALEIARQLGCWILIIVILGHICCAILLLYLFLGLVCCGPRPFEVRLIGQAGADALNKKQQAYFLKHGAFARNIDELESNSGSRTKYYRHQTQIRPGDRPIAVSSATPRRLGKGARWGQSYIGAVFILPLPGDEASSTVLSILCEKDMASSHAKSPTFQPITESNPEPQCPTGYRLPDKPLSKDELDHLHEQSWFIQGIY